MTGTASNTKLSDTDEFVKRFCAEEQKRADAAGMNIFEYWMQVEDGMLKPTILKILRHAKAHPDKCPEDCAFQRSFNELKKKYGVA